MKLSQKDKILAYIVNNGSITPLQALQHLKCLSLSQRVGQLRREGYNIVNVGKKVSKDDGSIVTIGLYKIVGG